jgi:hypothetical protein
VTRTYYSKFNGSPSAWLEQASEAASEDVELTCSLRGDATTGIGCSKRLPPEKYCRINSIVSCSVSFRFSIRKCNAHGF